MEAHAQNHESYDEIISAIYRCVEQSRSWTEPLDLLRSFMQANVACIRISQKGSSPRQHLFAAGPKVSQSALEEWEHVSAQELLPIDLPVGEAHILNWQAVTYGGGAYSKMLERYDIASMAVMSLDNLDGAQCTLNCSRGMDADPFSPHDLEQFRIFGRHFRRAMAIRQELTETRIVSHFQTDALDSLGIAAILVNKAGGCFLLNRTARNAIDLNIGLKISGNRLHTVNPMDDARFQTALRDAWNANGAGRTSAMLVDRGMDDNRINLIVNSRVHPSLVSDRPETSALVFLRVNEIVSHADVKLLQQLFSFTATEANLAVGLAKGLCLKDVETQLNIRHNTARAHLRSMFVKAEVTRQSQLVSLLTNSLVPLGRSNLETIQ